MVAKLVRIISFFACFNIFKFIFRSNLHLSFYFVEL